MGKCRDCKYWVKYSGEPKGRCKRYPPQIDRDGKSDEFFVQPETKNDDVCGEFIQE